MTKNTTKKTKPAPKPAAPEPKTAKPEKKKAKPEKKKSGAVTTVLSSEVVYQGPLFRVTKDRIVNPAGVESVRDVVRHNGSVVILAVDSPKTKSGKSKKDPWIVMEQQYRHAAGQLLWELPAGKLDPGEEALHGAQRELEEETGYRAKNWKLLVKYLASPGFLGESMTIFLAEGLIAGDAHPEADEQIEFRLVKLSDLLKKIEKGEIQDGKTLVGVMLYDRLKGKKKK
jgi:ADP-ribose pyrophosphatase